MTDARTLAGDTTDLRIGVPLHDSLLALLPLVGEWSGRGAGIVPSDGRPFAFVQHVAFAHDGRPFLAYESRTWLIDDAGEVIRPGARETGFWRPGAGPDDVEVVVALNTGLTVVLVGTAADQRWELASSVVASTPTAKVVDAHHRLYAVGGDELAYAQEIAPAGGELAPHLSARLGRTGSGHGSAPEP